MSKPVRLSEVVDSMQMQCDAVEPVFDRQTGQIEMVIDEAYDDPDDADAAEIRRQIEDDATGRFVPLPDPHEIHEWSMMERFAQSEAAQRVSDALLDAIRGSGAFRRFKDAAHRLGAIDRWYAYRDAACREIAAVWCERHGIPIEPEDPAARTCR